MVIHYERPAFLATSPNALESRLGRIASRVTERSAVYLDALDEAMIRTRTAALVLTTWIREGLAHRRPRLRYQSRGEHSEHGARFRRSPERAAPSSGRPSVGEPARRAHIP
jgi:hypothetical protein